MFYFVIQPTLLKYLLQNCFSGPALVFEGEESMLAAISEDPLSFKVCVLVGTVGSF
jgi:dihydroxyacid dehydratase/phosphogluconate dehydratase